MTNRISMAALPCVFILASFLTPPAVAQQVIDLQQLNEMKAKWQVMADEKKRISLEGRFAARAGNLVRLQQSKLVFRVREGIAIPRMKNGNNNTRSIFSFLLSPSLAAKHSRIYYILYVHAR